MICVVKGPCYVCQVNILFNSVLMKGLAILCDEGPLLYWLWRGTGRLSREEALLVFRVNGHCYSYLGKGCCDFSNQDASLPVKSISCEICMSVYLSFCVFVAPPCQLTAGG